MSFKYKGVLENSPNLDVRWWWNKPVNSKIPNRWYSNVGEAVNSRPHNTTVLSASVYADLDGQKRLVGYSMFPVLKLLTHQPIKAPVQRVYSKDPSGTLEIYNYDIKPVIASDLNTKDVSALRTLFQVE